MLAGKSANLRL